MKYFKRAIVVVLLAILILSLSLPFNAAENVEEAAEEISEETLQSNITELYQQKIDAYVEANKDTTAAVSVAIFTNNSVVFEKPYGYANIEGNLPNDSDTVFEWGSVTKLLTWVSVMQLVEQGKIDLNADIRTYLPEGFLTKLKYDDKITMLNLMNHNAGWQEAVTELFVDSSSKARTLEDSLKLLQPPQIYRPGETVGYSNFGSALAGYIVELISGTPFDEYVHKNIFAPLGVEHTALRPDLSDNLWVKEQRQKLNCYTTDNQSLGISDVRIHWYPCGQATGTLSDFIKFGQALIPGANGGSVLFGKTETFAEFFEVTDYYPDGSPNIRHGMFELTTLSGTVVGHGGNTAGCSSYLLVDLESGTGAVVMTNQSGELVYNNGLMGDIFGKAEFEPDSALPDPSPVAGLYKSSRSFKSGIQKVFGTIYYLSVSQNDDGSLFISSDISFKQVSPGIFLLSQQGYDFLYYADYDENGQVIALRGYTDDYLRVGYGEYIFNLVALALFAIAAIYSIVYLIVTLIRRIKKKKSPMGGWRLLLCGSIIITAINILLLSIMAISVAATLVSVTIFGILFIVLGLMPVVFTIILIRKWKQLALTKKQKTGLIVNSIMGLIVTFNIVFFQLWMFWV